MFANYLVKCISSDWRPPFEDAGAEPVELHPLMAKFAGKDLVDSLRNELASEQAQERWTHFLQAVAQGATEFERYQLQEEAYAVGDEYEDYGYGDYGDYY